MPLDVAVSINFQNATLYNIDMLYEKIQSRIKEAMLAKDNITRDCLRSIVAEAKNENLINKKELNDSLFLSVLTKSAKKHADSINDFKKAGREDLVSREQAELNIISSYLPKMKSTEETEAILKDLIAKNGISHEKKCMGQIMKLLKDYSNIDKKVASVILGKILE